MLRVIFTLWVIGATAICGVFFTPSDAFAQPQCDTRDSVIAVLSEKYKESQEAIGLTANGGLIEVYASHGGETWSIIVTTPQGMSCLVAAGDNWRQAPEAESEDPGT